MQLYRIVDIGKVGHRHAANAGDRYALVVDAGCEVGWAFPDGGAFAAIVPERAFISVRSVVPVIGISLVVERQPTSAGPV